jgi:hypothetical protein
MAHDTEPTERYLLMWPPYGDHIIFEPHDLHHLPDRIKEAEAQGVDRQLLADIVDLVVALFRWAPFSMR